MGEEFYGLWSIVYAITLFSNIGNMGITAIVNKFSAEDANGDIDNFNSILTSGFFLVLIMATLSSLLLLLTRGVISRNINTSVAMQIEFDKTLVWIALALFPQFLATVPQGFLLSQYKNGFVRSLDLIGKIFPWIGAILISLFQRNLVKIGEFFFLIQLIVFLTYFILLRYKYFYRINFQSVVFKKFRNFSLYMFLETVAVVAYQQLDRIIIGFILSPVAVGAYSVGTAMSGRITVLVGQWTDVMIPYASSKEAVDEKEKLYTIFRQLSRYVSLLVAGVSVFLMFWIKEILGIWISNEYATQYSSVIRTLILAYSLLSLSRPGHQTLTGIGKVKFTAVVYFITSGTMLLFVAYAASKWGLPGVVWANVIMAVLLIYNIKVYFLLAPSFSWIHVIDDLFLGVSLLFISYAISSMSIYFYPKVITFLFFD